MKTSPPPSAAPTTFAAADLGATSGRVILGRVGAGLLDLTEVHRFANTPVRLPDGLRWDVLALYQGILDGLRQAAHTTDGHLASIGVDTWAVDYGLLDADGALLGQPFHYRDARTDGTAATVWSKVEQSELYRITGLQHLPFNTVFQLASAAGSAQLAAARTLLLVPDLLIHWLTGSVGAEETNASTTGLFDARTGTWAPGLPTRLSLDAGLLPPLRAPGDPAGTLLPHVAAYTGLDADTPVTTVASHDTASAVVAVPATEPHFAYISCGTWSLAGLELDAPVLSEASRAANFTNERGIDGTIRYLRNIMGMWLLEESRRSWQEQGLPTDLPSLLADAAHAEPFAALIDPDAPEFLAPGDMPERIREFCRRTGQRVPDSQGALIRCVLESLALAHRRTLRQAADLADREIAQVHLVGGGSRNELLCQLTADATGLPVIAGPAEATALGNILVQARTAGLIGDRPAMRRLVCDTQPLRRYTPRGDSAAWDAAAARVESTTEGRP
ncbi:MULTISPECIES: rhamnulokinase [unclassified Streptomyces]|uniref:rhamnulokinase n=1 Tax=unclassified Streptomyces TaxID=2593676 RepID=UPI002DD965CF|nr:MULTISPECIES: rhamnulokinase family protein [unclassified Streptomyces]WSF82651.1 rhamnulokinase [Streptomyces sp. NBC_01744]WSC41093.1 rhamnulokinase [Streptomyces sp. NBC_01763]WSC51803.1 rhamnulokinase [Streptomyces sp. NBC_01761]WSD28854.1 rhamnulokinase [Streptomyces sp. NBC_01751]WSJ49142.1 rhamnulokinase [Streptomyces sp. NBC_01318]